jgi:plasmid stabilization system protein ParE
VNEIIFSRQAVDDLIVQAQFIFEQTQSVDSADHYLDGMKSFIIETLSHFPRAGRPAEEIAAGSRKLVYQGYSILYRIAEDHIEILTIYRENMPIL